MNTDKRTPAILMHPALWTTLSVLLVLSVGGRLLGKLAINEAYVHLNQGLAQAGDGRLDQAIEELRATTANPAARQRGWYGLAVAYLLAGREVEARAAWSRVDEAPSLLTAWAVLSEHNGEMSESRARLLLAAELEPENGDGWYRVARAAEGPDLMAARANYLRALAAPRHTDFGPSNILTRLGDLARQGPQPDWAGALAHYDDAIERDEFATEDDFVNARLGRAEALERLGRATDALAQYRWLIDSGYSYYWAFVHGGRLAWFIEKDAGTAVAYLQQAIAINDKSKWAYLNLGQVYEQAGRPELAIPPYESALALDPGDATAGERLRQLAGAEAP